MLRGLALDPRHPAASGQPPPSGLRRRGMETLRTAARNLLWLAVICSIRDGMQCRDAGHLASDGTGQEPAIPAAMGRRSLNLSGAKYQGETMGGGCPEKPDHLTLAYHGFLFTTGSGRRQHGSIFATDLLVVKLSQSNPFIVQETRPVRAQGWHACSANLSQVSKDLLEFS